MLRDSALLSSPVRYHTSQPVAQPANNTQCTYRVQSPGTGWGVGGSNNSRKCGFAGDSEQQADSQLRICDLTFNSSLWDHKCTKSINAVDWI